MKSKEKGTKNLFAWKTCPIWFLPAIRSPNNGTHWVLCTNFLHWISFWWKNYNQRSKNFFSLTGIGLSLLDRVLALFRNLTTGVMAGVHAKLFDIQLHMEKRFSC